MPTRGFLAEKERFLGRLKNQKRLQESTLKIYEMELRILERLLDEDASALERHLESCGPATASRKLVIWKAFSKLLPDSLRHRIEDLSSPKIRKKQPSFLTEAEVFRLENACYKTECPTRDRLFLALGLQLGLRLSEILQLRFSDFEAGWVRVIRKGQKEQRLPVAPSLQSQVELWRSESYAQPGDPLFQGRTHSLGARSAQKLIERLRQSAGIQKKITPHSLRHTFASTLAARGANLAALKELLGHEKITTTEKYLHVTPEHLKETLRLLNKSSLT